MRFMLTLFLTVPIAASATEGDLEALAARVAKARAEVDTLSADVDTLRAEARDEQLALARRTTALESDLDVARMKGKGLEARIAILETASEERGNVAAPLVEPLRNTVARLRAQVTDGIPFKVKDRNAKLDEIERALDADGPARALELLATFIDSEIELGRTNARVRQPVIVDGKPVMADVVRLGRVAMIFRTKEGDVGYAAPSSRSVAPATAEPRSVADEPTWRVFDRTEDRALAATLFDAFSRVNMNGIVLVPRLALARAEAK